jgi:hypothetical protein
MTEERGDWRELCATVAKEEDPKKLLALVEELIAVLDRRERPSLIGSGERSRKTTEPESADC